jgi:hypothetical protein
MRPIASVLRASIHRETKKSFAAKLQALQMSVLLWYAPLWVRKQSFVGLTLNRTNLNDSPWLRDSFTSPSGLDRSSRCPLKFCGLYGCVYIDSILNKRKSITISYYILCIN